MATDRGIKRQMWQRALGCCVICGMPMEMPGRVQDQSNNVSRDIDAVIPEEDGNKVKPYSLSLP